MVKNLVFVLYFCDKFYLCFLFCYVDIWVIIVVKDIDVKMCGVVCGFNGFSGCVQIGENVVNVFIIDRYDQCCLVFWIEGFIVNCRCGDVVFIVFDKQLQEVYQCCLEFG